MEIQVITEPTSRQEVKKMAQTWFDDIVKGVVDIEKKILALGGEWHSDAEAVLLEKGSAQHNLWGFNLFLNQPADKMIEYTSLINIRPAVGNRTMVIEDPVVKQQVQTIIEKLII